MLFWLIVGALAAAAALGVSVRAAGAARRAAAGAPDPTLAVHARQLTELDDLHRRGLLGAPELEAARAEAGRRLLSAADRAPAVERPGGASARTVVTVGAGAAALSALGLYLALGRPGLPDQPYGDRLRAWMRRDPATLDAPELAAVLRTIAVQRPTDPRVFEFLGRAELAAGDPGGAATAFARAARLDPADADDPAAAGEALMAGGAGKVTPEAEAHFREALRRDPSNPAARYHLAKLAVAQGDVAGGRAALQALLAGLAPADPRRDALAAEVAATTAPAPLAGGPDLAQVAAAARAAPAGGAEQAAFIRGMVDRLAQRLASKPDDVDGWARLVRAYGVLGDPKAQADALTRARTVFARRPADLARVQAEARPFAAAR